VPIDLEMILQATTDEHKSQDVEAHAMEAAMDELANSVLAVGLLPAYGKALDNNIFSIGGVVSDWNSRKKLMWHDINSATISPSKSTEVSKVVPNLPHFNGRYAKFGDHVEDFVSGFEDYAQFLLRQSSDATQGDLFDGFAGVPVRKVIRATRFYSMLLQRLRE